MACLVYLLVVDEVAHDTALLAMDDVVDLLWSGDYNAVQAHAYAVDLSAGTASDVTLDALKAVAKLSRDGQMEPPEHLLPLLSYHSLVAHGFDGRDEPNPLYPLNFASMLRSRRTLLGPHTYEG